MIDFKPLTLAQKEEFDKILQACPPRGCEYSFANLYIWGRQKAAFIGETQVFFSQFNRKSVYPFPVGGQDLKPALDAIIHDAAQRGIPCRLTGLTQDDCALLKKLYPGRFRYHFDRDFFDYVYAIEDLAHLKGKKYQRKRNRLNSFYKNHPNFTVVPITRENLPQVADLASRWYAKRQMDDPTADTLMEQAALKKALSHYRELGMEGLLLQDGGVPLAMTMGNFLSHDTFDVNFEKAIEPEAYPAINREFALYLQGKYPHLRFLNREDDMGLEGLRKAKMQYLPHHLVEKSWACLLEDGYDY